MDYSCVVVAAGKSERFGTDKNKLLYTLSNGKTVLESSLQLFREDDECKELIVVCNEETMKYLYSNQRTTKETYVYGGEDRSHSVFNGLMQVHNDLVLVHDGARCYLLKEDLEQLKAAMTSEDAALLTRKETDTVKEVRNGYVVRSINRDMLNRALTPQAFKTRLLIESYRRSFENGDAVTDEASVMEKYSDVAIKCIICKGHNDKVTTMNDIL